MWTSTVADVVGRDSVYPYIVHRSRHPAQSSQLESSSASRTITPCGSASNGAPPGHLLTPSPLEIQAAGHPRLVHPTLGAQFLLFRVDASSVPHEKTSCRGRDNRAGWHHPILQRQSGLSPSMHLALVCRITEGHCAAPPGLQPHTHQGQQPPAHSSKNAQAMG